MIDSWGFADPFPERFDEQGTQDLCGPIAAPESLRDIERLWGWDVVRRYMSDLADYAERRVSEAASEVGGEDCSSPVRIPSPAMRLVRSCPMETARRRNWTPYARYSVTESSTNCTPKSRSPSLTANCTCASPPTPTSPPTP